MVRYTGTLHQLCDGGDKYRGNWDRANQYVASILSNPGHNEEATRRLREEAMDRQGPNVDETPLRIAIVRGAPSSVVKSLLEVAPEAAASGDRFDRLPLHWACRRPTGRLLDGGDPTEGVESPTRGGVVSATSPARSPSGRNNGNGGGSSSRRTTPSPSRSVGGIAIPEPDPDDSAEVIRTLIARHPRGVIGRDREGKTPLHWAFLFHPHTRTTSLVELFLEEIRDGEMVHVPPPGPRFGEHSHQHHHHHHQDEEQSLSNLSVRTPVQQHVVTQQMRMTLTPPKPPTAVAVAVATATKNTPSGNGHQHHGPLPLELFSSQANVHHTPSKSAAKKGMMLAEAAATTVAQTELVPHRHLAGTTPAGQAAVIPSYPNNAAAVPDYDNCLPLHYAVNVDDDDRRHEDEKGEDVEEDRHLGVGGGGGPSSPGGVRSPSGSTTSPTSPTTPAPITARRDVVGYLIRRHPNSVSWRDVNDRTPLQWHLVGRDHYLTLLSEHDGDDDEDGEGGGGGDENVEAAEAVSPSNNLIGTTIGPPGGDEDGDDDEYHGGGIISKQSSTVAEAMECTLAAEGEGGVGDGGVRVEATVSGRAATVGGRAEGGETPLATTGTAASTSSPSSGQRRVVVAPTLLVPCYPGGYRSTTDANKRGEGGSVLPLPASILSSTHPHRSSALVGMLIDEPRGGSVCSSGDATYDRTPLHWACYLLVVSQVRYHLEHVTAAKARGGPGRDPVVGSPTSAGDNDGTTTLSRSGHHEVCLSLHTLRCIIDGDPAALSRGDALRMTPLHVLCYTAFVVSCVIHRNHRDGWGWEDDDDDKGADDVEEELGEDFALNFLRGLDDGASNSAPSGSAFASAAEGINCSNGGSGWIGGYWSGRPPAPLPVPGDYVRFLIESEVGGGVVPPPPPPPPPPRRLGLASSSGIIAGSSSSATSSAIGTFSSSRDSSEGGAGGGAGGGGGLDVPSNASDVDGSHGGDGGARRAEDGASSALTPAPGPAPTANQSTKTATTLAALSDDAEGRLPIHYAALAAAGLAVLTDLIRVHPMGLIATEDVFNRTPLHFAFSSSVTARHQTVETLDVMLSGGGGGGGSPAAGSGGSPTAPGGGGGGGPAPSVHQLLLLPEGIGLAALKMEDSAGNYPLHLACENGASASVIGRLIDAHVEAAWCANGEGDYPIMTLVGLEAGYERRVMRELLGIVVPGDGDDEDDDGGTASSSSRSKRDHDDDSSEDDGDDAARANAGRVEPALLARIEERWSERRDKVDVVLRPFLTSASTTVDDVVGIGGAENDVVDAADTMKYTLTASSSMGETPLHIALWHEMKPSVIARLIAEGAEAAGCRTRDGYLPIDLHEMRRAAARRDRTQDDSATEGIGDDTPPDVVGRSERLTETERNEIQDLLFVNHPNIMPYRRDGRLLSRLVSRIRNDIVSHEHNFRVLNDKMASSGSFENMVNALENGSSDSTEQRGNIRGEGGSGAMTPDTNRPTQRQPSSSGLGLISRLAWDFFTTYSNPEDERDHYADLVGEVIRDLPHDCVIRLAELSVFTDGGRAEANPLCVRAIDEAFYLFGSFKFFLRDTTLPTGTIVRDTFDSIRVLHRSADDESLLLKVDRIVHRPTRALHTPNEVGGHGGETDGQAVCLKLLKSKRKYEREVESRNAIMTSRSSEDEDDDEESSDTSSRTNNDNNIQPVLLHYSLNGERNADRRFRNDVHGDRFNAVLYEVVSKACCPRREDQKFPNSAAASIKLSNYPYAIVTSLADCDLGDVLRHGNMTMEDRKLCAVQVGNAIRFLHEKNIIHGDIRMLNVLRLGQSWVLSGLSSSSNLSNGDCMLGEIGTFSTSILPPEMFVKLDKHENGTKHGGHWRKHYTMEPTTNPDGSVFTVKSFCDGLQPQQSKELPSNWDEVTAETTDADSNFSPQLPYELVPCSESIDIWSFGCLFYTLCTGRPLFPTDFIHDDLIDPSSYATLAQWDTETAESIVYRNVQDPLAQDLLLHVLAPASERSILSMGDVMRHPFFSGTTALSNAAQKIIEMRKSEAERLTNMLDHQRKSRELQKWIESRTVVIRRLPIELQLKMDHASTAIARGASLIPRVEGGEEEEASGKGPSALPAPTIPLGFIVLPYKLVRSKSGKLTPSTKKGVELAEKVGKQFLLMSKAIDQYLIDPLQSAEDLIYEHIRALLRLYEDAPKSFLYLVDEYHGIAIVNPGDDVYPYAISNQLAPQIVLKYLPFIHIQVLHARGSTGGVSGLVKLIFEGAYPHIPGSWAEASKGLVHRLDRDSMIGEIKALVEHVADLETAPDLPEANDDRFKSLETLFEKIDSRMTFSGLKRVTEGGSEALWTTAAGVSEVQRKANPKMLLAAHRQRIAQNQMITEKDAKIKSLEASLAQLQRQTDTTTETEELLMLEKDQLASKIRALEQSLAEMQKQVDPEKENQQLPDRDAKIRALDAPLTELQAPSDPENKDQVLKGLGTQVDEENNAIGEECNLPLVSVCTAMIHDGQGAVPQVLEYSESRVGEQGDGSQASTNSNTAQEKCDELHVPTGLAEKTTNAECDKEKRGSSQASVASENRVSEDSDLSVCEVSL